MAENNLAMLLRVGVGSQQVLGYFLSNSLKAECKKSRTFKTGGGGCCKKVQTQDFPIL